MPVRLPAKYDADCVGSEPLATFMDGILRASWGDRVNLLQMMWPRYARVASLSEVNIPYVLDPGPIAFHEHELEWMQMSVGELVGDILASDAELALAAFMQLRNLYEVHANPVARRNLEVKLCEWRRHMRPLHDVDAEVRFHGDATDLATYQAGLREHIQEHEAWFEAHPLSAA